MKFDHKEMFEALQRSENVKVRYKDESWLMKLIGKLMFYNPDFSTHFITTLGETVYFPSRSEVETDYQIAWEVLSHEAVHVEDYRNSKPKFLFMLKYMMPQILAVFALLAPVLWSWWPLLALVFLLPLPAPWRRDIEMRGYAMSMAVWYWYSRSGIPQALKSETVDHFTGAEYYFTYPFKQAVTEEVGRWSKRILCNEMDQYGAIYGRVKRMIESRIKS